MTDKTLRLGWQLLVRVEIDKSRRVQCQCRGCGKTVYADVHLIQWPDGELACWGSRCFERELGIAGRNLQAVYGRVNGHRLTDEERALLDANREALIARIKGLEEEISQAEKRREQALNIVKNSDVAKPLANLPEITPESVREPARQPQIISPPTIKPSPSSQRPGLPPRRQPQTVSPPTIKPAFPVRYNERSHRYTIIFRNQAGEIVKQLYRGDEQFCRRFIAREIENYPSGTKAEIIMTKTGRLVYQQRKG